MDIRLPQSAAFSIRMSRFPSESTAYSINES